MNMLKRLGPLLLMGAILGGCSAPVQVQTAQGIKELAFRQYLANNRTAWNAALAVLKDSRDRTVAAADATFVEQSIAATLKENKSDTMTPAQVRDLYRTGAKARADADGRTVELLARLNVVRNKADVSFAQAQALDKEIAAFMAAGVDDALFAEMTQYILGTALPLFNSGKGPK